MRNVEPLHSPYSSRQSTSVQNRGIISLYTAPHSWFRHREQRNVFFLDYSRFESERRELRTTPRTFRRLLHKQGSSFLHQKADAYHDFCCEIKEGLFTLSPYANLGYRYKPSFDIYHCLMGGEHRANDARTSQLHFLECALIYFTLVQKQPLQSLLNCRGGMKLPFRNMVAIG